MNVTYHHLMYALRCVEMVSSLSARLVMTVMRLAQMDVLIFE